MIFCSIISFVFGIMVGALVVGAKIKSTVLYEKKRSYHISVLNNSISKLPSQNLMPYFINHGYKKVIIYGMGAYYSKFMSMIDENLLEIAISDKKANTGKNFYSPSQISQVDADIVVVTAITFFEEIWNELRNIYNVKCDIVSFQDVVYYVSKEHV